MSKRVLCKFFAQGACLKGDHCDFSHDQNNPSRKICKFYQKGHCSYGSRCRYQHIQHSQSNSSTPSSSGPTLSASSTPFYPPTKPTDRPICGFAAAGTCPYNEGCPYIHGDKCPTCGKHCLHPYKPKEAEEHTKACQKQKNHVEALKRSREIECGVCLEKVLSKPTAAERKFGLLSECDHPFCISCIRNWRSSSPTIGMDLNSSLRACPLCRKLSYFVIPSVIWYSTKEEKQEIIASYKSKLRSIDCKHFEFGNGTCPFGTSCFYKHTVEPGSYLWNSTLGLENDGPGFLDSDETDTIYSADDLNVDRLHVLFEHLHRSHIEEDDEDNEEEEQEEVENESGDDELDEELSLAEAMAFLLMQPGFDDCDLSSNDDDVDDIYIP